MIFGSIILYLYPLYRDAYIDIHFDNIPTYVQHNFFKLPPYYINSRGVTYDYNSVMHYSSVAFSLNGKDTISANEPGIPIGPEFGLSKLDAIQANLMYQCTSKLYLLYNHKICKYILI